MQAAERKRIAINPCAGVKLPEIRHKEMRFLQPDQIATLADCIGPRYRGFVLLGAYGGLRLGELWGLRRKRVDLMKRRVDVAEIAVEVRGTITYGLPKTEQVLE